MLPAKWRMKNKINNKRWAGLEAGGRRGRSGIEGGSCSKLLRTANSEQISVVASLHKQRRKGKQEKKKKKEHAYLSNNFLTLFSGFCFVLSGFFFYFLFFD